MKLITELKSLEKINKYNVDGLIFSHPQFGTIANKTFTFSEMEEIVNYCHAHNKLALLKVDKIMEENELEALFAFLDNTMRLNIDYYLFSDMAVLNYFQTRKQEYRLIYVAKTLNCSYLDAEFYQKRGIKVMLSNELTLDDIIHISSLDNIVLDGYGYSNIFYSKRKLLSLYNEAKALGQNLPNKLLHIQEENRDNKYPIYENQNGTFIFTSYKYLFYKELEAVKNLFMFKIESIFIEEEALFTVIDVFQKALHGDINDQDYQTLIDLDQNVGHSFLYKKPSILGEENEA